MARSNRIQITVTPAMTVALEVLSERTGLPIAQQAMVLLRQGLDRTMGSAAVQSRVAARRASRTSAEWRDETGTEHVVEGVYAAFAAATREEVAHFG